MLSSSSSTSVKGLLDSNNNNNNNNNNEEPLAPDITSYAGGNQSTQYSSSSSGFHGNYSPELDVSPVIVVTSSPSTTSTVSPSTSSTSAVRSEVNPLSPPTSVTSEKDKSGSLDTDFRKSWPDGEGSDVTETSYRDWAERERPLDESDSGYINMDVKWSDRMPESEPTLRTPVFPTQNSHHGSRNNYDEGHSSRGGVYRPSPGEFPTNIYDVICS